MLRNIKVEDMTITDELGTKWELHYFIKVLKGQHGDDVYGLKVEMRPGDDNESFYEETEGLTYSYAEVEEWARRLASGTVTPMSLHALVDEWV